MNRQLTALFAAFEALLVIAIGIGIPLVPLTILWGAQYGFAVDWTAFWRASVDLWLVGHGVDITLVLDPATAAGLGIPDAGAPVTLTIAALGFALLTVVLGVRAGRRLAETRHRALGELASLGAFGLASFAVTFTSRHPDASPSLWQGTVLPTAVFAIGLVIGVRRTQAGQDAAPGSFRDPTRDWRPDARATLVAALRGGAAAAAGIITLASLATAALIVASYAKVISLYESLHSELLGGIAVTLGQIALLPNIVIWTASWLVGPGFALGTGSSVSPLGTQLGPVPAIPILGALPPGQLAFGFVGLLVPVVAGFLVGAILGPALRREAGGALLVAAGLGVGLVGGVILGLLAWFSAGAAGPGRLADVGPNPWAVGVAAAIELGVAATIGLLTTVRRAKASR
ncbi:MAG: hypothetical protein JWP19_1681 [Rhodoglobus sp.]|nr:hypothetical protein [Rhodoglobus sp.]